MVKNCNSWKLKSFKPYIAELTVFIKVKIDNLKEFSNDMPEMVNNDVKNNKKTIKKIRDKKYLLSSILSIFVLRKRCLLEEIFKGLKCDTSTFNENLNKE